MAVQRQISVLLLFLHVFVVASPAFLSHDLEGRQILPCEVSCGDGWCCFNLQTCLKSSVGDPYLCVDQQLTNADGSSMTFPAFDEGSLDSAVSSINSDLSSFSLSIITTPTVTPSNPGSAQPPPAATPTPPPAAPPTVIAGPVASQSSQPIVPSPSSSPITASVAAPPSQKFTSNAASTSSSLSSQKSVAGSSRSANSPLTKASSGSESSTAAGSTAQASPSSSSARPALITGASEASRLLGIFGGCSVAVGTMFMMVLGAFV